MFIQDSSKDIHILREGDVRAMEDLRKRVLRHIKFARSWLEKAENEFSTENNVKGELTLTLVQAEVKHAWEASRKAKSSEGSHERPRISRRGHLRLLPGVIIIALFTAVIFNFAFGDEMRERGATDFPQLLANGIEKKIVEVNKDISDEISTSIFLNYEISSEEEGGTNSSDNLKNDNDSINAQSGL